MTDSGEVHVTKIAAAQRQLRAAVRMFFVEEDVLAVHTVASAAYRIVRDLKDDRDRKEAGDVLLTAIFYGVRDYRRGTLPPYLADDPDMMTYIRDLVEQLPIDADSKFEDFKLTLSPDAIKEFHYKTNAAANFLKHAEHDGGAHLSLDEIDNLQLLMQTYGAYVDLVPNDLGTEGFVLWLYYSVTKGTIEGLPPDYKATVEQLEQLAPADRLKACSELILRLKEKNRINPCVSFRRTTGKRCLAKCCCLKICPSG
jgi:hypothetical protein